jgi:hypothetical protein
LLAGNLFLLFVLLAQICNLAAMFSIERQTLYHSVWICQ